MFKRLFCNRLEANAGAAAGRRGKRTHSFRVRCRRQRLDPPGAGAWGVELGHELQEFARGLKAAVHSTLSNWLLYSEF